MRIQWASILISVLILISGWYGSHSLTRVDKDLRVIYAEYTLAATDLGHVSGELIRYRTSVIRAIEADNKEDFERIAGSLPHKRTRIENAIQRFVQATNDSSNRKRMDARELAEVRAVRERMDAYISSSYQAIQLMKQRWSVVSELKTKQLQAEAKQYWVKDATSNFDNLTVELDRLLEVVAVIAAEVKNEADASLRLATLAVLLISLVLGTLVLVMPKRTGSAL
jgi:hypothetical protein